MTRVTGKFQITLPKRLADAYGIRVGDEIDIVAAGESIAIRPAGAGKAALSSEERLRQFDAATRRQESRQRETRHSPAKDRGWTREDLHTRARPR
ncbi:MAG: AbrB/MazE/SpoVT family DNA-binding domain-containing protein [Proteobacteria bacterium]|nr:AbrB/MazE/SpoVT family DNA-binding domain-containing protein [Pseudomonadota bacterium]